MSTFGETYLTSPELFPTRPAGEDWGAGMVEMDFAGGLYRIEGLSGEQERMIRGRYGDLSREGSGLGEAASGPRPAQGGSPMPGAGAASFGAPGTGSSPEETTWIHVYRAEEEDFRPRGEAGNRWDERIDLDYEEDAVRMAGAGFMGRLDWRSGVEASIWTAQGAGRHFLSIFEDVLRVTTAYRLLDEGGVLLRSAGVVLGNGDAVLCVGRTGAGKSTISRLAMGAGLRVLSDELNALLPGDGVPRAGRTPFTGEVGRQAHLDPGESTYPVERIFRLEKGEDDEIRELSDEKLLSSLSDCTLAVSEDPHREEELTESLENLLAEIGGGVLVFAEDGTPWKLLDG